MWSARSSGPRRELYGWLTTVEDGAVRRRGLLAVSAYQIGIVLARLRPV